MATKTSWDSGENEARQFARRRARFIAFNQGHAGHSCTVPGDVSLVGATVGIVYGHLGAI
jgi:hypothetical protein